MPWCGLALVVAGLSFCLVDHPSLWVGPGHFAEYYPVRCPRVGLIAPDEEVHGAHNLLIFFGDAGRNRHYRHEPACVDLFRILQGVERRRQGLQNNSEWPMRQQVRSLPCASPSAVSRTVVYRGYLWILVALSSAGPGVFFPA